MNDTIECLLCGALLQRLANHLRSKHNLTTEQYRMLFPGAPVVSPSLAQSHSAKMSGRKPAPQCRKPRRGPTLICEVCGAPFYVRPSAAATARFCSWACMHKGRHITWSHLPVMCGPDNPNWRGGYEPYYGPNWQRQRRRARKRDNYSCQCCGKTEAELGQQLDVHHIKPFRDFGPERYQEANRLHNLISLCKSCHSLITNGVIGLPNIQQGASETLVVPSRPHDTSE